MKTQKDHTLTGGISRRKFLKAAAVAAAGIITAPDVNPRPSRLFSSKTRYVIVGTGHRSQMFMDAVYKKYNENSEIVGLCDTNFGRLQYYQSYGKNITGKSVPIYDAAQFDAMINDTKPEIVIVTTVDGTHHQYIIRAMELGCNVITEKPMTTDEFKCQQIIDAQKKFGKKIIVSFNYRYSPPRTQIKEILMSGIIGNILSVDFHWMLNTQHGADYFRRWHSQKKYSGGLMVHKATHHFDLVNWWLSAIPVTVFAKGKREFYTPEMAKRFGLRSYHERCYTCPEKSRCAFELDFEKNKRLKTLYLDNEKYDGYFRDRCVFRPEIDIEDTMNVIVKYNTNATMSYSLNAFNSWEGYYVIFNGSNGRLEHKVEEKVYVAGDDNIQGALKEGGTSIRVFPLRGVPYEVEVWQGEGGHGGGDEIMLDDLFSENPKSDKYLRIADQRAGAYSILTGVAANNSISSGLKIKVNDLVSGIGMPDYTLMPGDKDPLPMPVK